MKVTEQDVRHVAALAHLDLTEAERARMLRDLNHILEYIDRLDQLDTSKVAPMACSEGAGPAGDAMRADQHRPSLPHEAALQNAPETDGRYFTVPKVIER